MKRWLLDARNQAPLGWSRRSWKRGSGRAQGKHNASPALGEGKGKLDSRMMEPVLGVHNLQNVVFRIK
jgi:hypothetical protein